MGAYGFEGCGTRIKVFSHCEGNEGSVVSGEEVFISRDQVPVVNFVEFSEAACGQFFFGPLHYVVRGDSVVDKLQEGFS